MHACELTHESVCVVVCCSVLQCVAVCCSVLQCVAVCCDALRCVLRCVALTHTCTTHACDMSHESICVAVCCSVSSMLQYVSV